MLGRMWVSNGIQTASCVVLDSHVQVIKSPLHYTTLTTWRSMWSAFKVISVCLMKPDAYITAKAVITKFLDKGNQLISYVIIALICLLLL